MVWLIHQAFKAIRPQVHGWRYPFPRACASLHPLRTNHEPKRFVEVIHTDESVDWIAVVATMGKNDYKPFARPPTMTHRSVLQTVTFLIEFIGN